MYNMLTIGKKAITSAEKHLEVTAHNITNVNTPGFSRQRVVQETSYAIQQPWANIPTGVDLIRIERMRDLFLDTEYRKLNGDNGYWNSMAKNLSELEKSVIETSEYGIHAMINNFFNTWEFLSNNPYSTIHRMDVVSAAQDMIGSFQDLYRSIDTRIDDVKFQIRASVDRINQIADEMSSLMKNISLSKALGAEANDLLDKFDLLMDELSSYGDVRVEDRGNGTSSVYFGTVELVRNGEPQKLQLVDEKNSMTGEHEFFIAWNNIKQPLSGMTSGSIKALYDLHDTILPGYQQKLDNLVVQIANNVNAIHSQGYNITDPPTSGFNFFADDVTGVMSFKLNKDILADVQFIATSLTGATGDNQIALMITDLRNSKIFDGQTLTESFADIVYFMGSDVKNAKLSSDRAGMVTQQTDNFRDSVKGVSINEETANLMKFQQAYQAAARIISVADDMMKTIIGLAR